MNKFFNFRYFQISISTILMLLILLLNACSDNSTPVGVNPTNPVSNLSSSQQSIPASPKSNNTISVATTNTVQQVTTEAPITLQVTKGITDTITAPTLGTSEANLKATGFNADESKQLLDQFTDPKQIGTRVVGSEGEKKAADWLENHYKTYGYTDIERQQFPFNNPEVRAGTIFTGEANNKNVKATGILLSKPQKLQFESTIVFYAPNVDLKDKIVVITTGGDYASEKPVVDAIVKGGGAAILIPRIGLQPDYKTFADVEIPVIVVSFNNLPNLQPAPTPEKVTLQTSYTPASSGAGQNIIAKRPGPNPNAPVLIFGGHYDGVANSLAANGNASGAIVTLELAKVLFNKFPNYELRFINFSGTETGLAGSLYYVSKLGADDKKRIAAYVDLSLLGVGDSFVTAGTKELVDTAITTAGQSGLTLANNDPAFAGFSGDYVTFINNGIKTLLLARWQDPQYHKPGDTPDRIFPAALLIAGGTAILTAQKIAGS